ncbi:hypothetical protein [Tardiphaga sp.]|uniref:hypothetical protein n=1 Tax=Tardiphaga sp. TaxID=1926292 RepID=UPI0025E02AB8|nr:hypothetical protein [Tardiphaga sp.]
MTLDAGPRLAPGEVAPSRTRPLALWLAAALLLAVALALRALLPFNVDVSWWLIVGERVLDGQRLYVDILETNPPMAGSVYFLGVALARALDLRPETVTDALVFGLMAVSLGVTWRLLRGRAAAGALALWALALLGILPMYDFGQREHLALIAMLPSLAVYIRRADRVPVSAAAVLIAGLSAAITMSFKPYFALAAGACVVAAAVHARRWRVLFAPENAVAAALVAIYGGWVYLAFPAYFTKIYPLVRDVYLLLTAPLLALFVSAASALCIAAVLAVLALRRGRGLDAVLVVSLAAALGFAVAFFAQGKGWGYHAYPMVALSLMALGYAIAMIDRAAPRWRRWRGVAAGVAAVMFINAAVWFNASVDVSAIEKVVAGLAPHPKILMLGGAATLGHPMVRNLRGHWVSRQEALLIREIVRRARETTRFDAATSARLDSYAQRERDDLVEDFRKQPPDVVLVDNDHTDWGAWAAADPELSALLKPYERVRTIHAIDILRRTTP